MQTIYQNINYLSNALQNCHKVMLVCDSSFVHLNIKEYIEEQNVKYVKFDQFTPNPQYEDVCKGVELFNKTKCDTILAVGGGSSIDVAKCIKLYCKMRKDVLYLEQPYEDTGIRLIAIPTTAGTGSESTRYAVIYHKGKKQSVTHESIIPDIAILEPTVLRTLPLYQKKCTMLDALCQGIESWWSINSTDESKQYSKTAIETIMQWWHKYIFDYTDEAASQIMTAANYAGRAICITQTTAPHAFSYKITSLCGLPHGHAVAICLPEIWKYMLNDFSKCIDSRGIIYLQNVFHDISNAMGCVNSYDAIMKVRQMLNQMEIFSPSTENRNKSISILCDSVNPIRLKNNPIYLDQDSIKTIYGAII